VPTSSARPDALAAAADGLQVTGGALEAAARQAWSLVERYGATCPDAPLDLRTPNRSGNAVADLRVLAFTLRQVAEAFVLADTARPGGLAATTDDRLAEVVLAELPDLDGALSAPARVRGERGAALAARLARLLDQGRTDELERAVTAIAAGDLRSPSFAAALLNGIGPDRLPLLTEELVRGSGRHHPNPALTRLGDLFAAATRTRERRPLAHPLDDQLEDTLLRTPQGRATVRVLLSATAALVSATFLARAAGPLLLHHDAEGDGTSGPLSAFVGDVPGADGDAAVLAHFARDPHLAADLLSPARGSAEARVTRLLELAHHDAQDELARVIAAALAGPDLDPVRGDGRRRQALLRGLVAGVGERRGGGPIGEPLARVLAGTLVSDPGYFIGRSDRAGSGELDPFLTAITEYDRSWITGLTGLHAEAERRVRATLLAPAEERQTVLLGLSRLLDRYELAARSTDAARDTNAAGFAVLAQASVLARSAAGSALGPVAGAAAGAVTTAGIEAWHRSTIPEPDDHEGRTRARREAFRRQVWATVAHQPELARQIVWPQPSPRYRPVIPAGDRIRDVDDLLGLRGTVVDGDELAAWEDLQPPALRALVDSYVDGLGVDCGC
jgi:hypothetical protein